MNAEQQTKVSAAMQAVWNEIAFDVLSSVGNPDCSVYTREEVCEIVLNRMERDPMLAVDDVEVALAFGSMNPDTRQRIAWDTFTQNFYGM